MKRELPSFIFSTSKVVVFIKKILALVLIICLGSCSAFNLFGNTFNDNFSGDADIEISYEANEVQITQSTGGNPIIGNITYTFTVTNNGPDDATNLKVGINYHDEVIVFDRILSAGYWDTYQWIIPSLPAGASVQLTESSNIFVPYNNKWVMASLLEMDQDDPDSTPGNWDFTEDDSDRLEILSPKSDLRLTLKPNDYVYEVYEHVFYEVKLTNSGPSVATNVSVSFPLPPGMVYSLSNATDGTYDLYYESWDIGSLDIGQTATLILDLFTLDEDAPKTAFVQVQTVDQPDPDSSPGNDTDQSPDEDDEAAITIYDTASAFADLAINAFSSYHPYEPGESDYTHFDISNDAPLSVPAGIRVSTYLTGHYLLLYPVRYQSPKMLCPVIP